MVVVQERQQWVPASKSDQGDWVWQQRLTEAGTGVDMGVWRTEGRTHSIALEAAWTCWGDWAAPQGPVHRCKRTGEQARGG